MENYLLKGFVSRSYLGVDKNTIGCCGGIMDESPGYAFEASQPEHSEIRHLIWILCVLFKDETGTIFPNGEKTVEKLTVQNYNIRMGNVGALVLVRHVWLRSWNGRFIGGRCLTYMSCARILTSSPFHTWFVHIIKNEYKKKSSVATFHNIILYQHHFSEYEICQFYNIFNIIVAHKMPQIWMMPWLYSVHVLSILRCNTPCPDLYFFQFNLLLEKNMNDFDESIFVIFCSISFRFRTNSCFSFKQKKENLSYEIG